MTYKIDFESPFFALFDKLAKLDKASQDAYNPGGWLILYDRLKNWVAEGVASEVNDFTGYILYEFYLVTDIVPYFHCVYRPVG